MKTLIVYYSFSYNNTQLANYLQEQLHCDTQKITEAKKRTGLKIFLDLIFNRRPPIMKLDRSLADYENLVFIAPIWGGKIATPLKSLLLQERKNIKRYSFITVCSGAEGQQDKIEKELASLVGRQAEIVTELWINDLLPPEERNTIQYTTGYRISQNDLQKFSDKLNYFKHVTEADHLALV